VLAPTHAAPHGVARTEHSAKLSSHTQTDCCAGLRVWRQATTDTRAIQRPQRPTCDAGNAGRASGDLAAAATSTVQGLVLVLCARTWHDGQLLFKQHRGRRPHRQPTCVGCDGHPAAAPVAACGCNALATLRLTWSGCILGPCGGRRSSGSPARLGAAAALRVNWRLWSRHATTGWGGAVVWWQRCGRRVVSGQPGELRSVVWRGRRIARSASPGPKLASQLLLEIE
jgi:hypothetical protein